MPTHTTPQTLHTRGTIRSTLLPAAILSLTLGAAPLAFGGLHEIAALSAGDAATGDYFGYPVAIDGDTALVGAYVKDGNGAVYVFERSAGVWTDTAKLTPDDAGTNDGFGYAMAIEGDTIVVGSIYADLGEVLDAGAAYVFTRSAGTWTQAAKLIAPDAEEGDFFGGSVGISGDTILVGAMYADHYSGQTDAGAVYAFDRIGGIWTETDKLFAADPQGDDHFGMSIAIEASTAIIGAADDDVGTALDAGSAYVFVRTGGYWGQTAKLAAPDGAEGDYFGASVALSGNTIVVGAYGHAPGGLEDAGAAYVFGYSGGLWSQAGKLTAYAAATTDLFGVSVAVVGDRALIGADLAEPAGGALIDVGAAYTFLRADGVWRQTAKLTASEPADYDALGISVALSVDTILCGVPHSGHAGIPGAGAAYVFDAVRRGGDTNCDGGISYADINPFVHALNSRSLYESRYPLCDWFTADCNFDGDVSYADINPFVRLLAAP